MSLILVSTAKGGEMFIIKDDNGDYFLYETFRLNKPEMVTEETADYVAFVNSFVVKDEVVGSLEEAVTKVREAVTSVDKLLPLSKRLAEAYIPALHQKVQEAGVLPAGAKDVVKRLLALPAVYNDEKVKAELEFFLTK